MSITFLSSLASVLGMNHRNRHLVSKLNDKALISLANDKAAAKERLAAAGVPVPATLYNIRSHRDIHPSYENLRKSGAGFVLKPSCSSRGRGVLICSQAQEKHVVGHDGTRIPRSHFAFLLAQILDGEFSFGRALDTAIIEQRLSPDASWIMPKAPGAPDLRIIVSHGTPVMAMARVPTEESDGKANLHRGAVGVGVDLTTGKTVGGVWKNRPVKHHPNTRETLAGHHVQGFQECLEAAKLSYQAVPLGYMGVDILFDAHLGPMVIEINARPGLAVQMANRQGLMHKCSNTPLPTQLTKQDDTQTTSTLPDPAPANTTAA
jgi:alpha-L-glutamate ligase-like protein